MGGTRATISPKLNFALQSVPGARAQYQLVLVLSRKHMLFKRKSIGGSNGKTCRRWRKFPGVLLNRSGNIDRNTDHLIYWKAFTFDNFGHYIYLKWGWKFKLITTDWLNIYIHWKIIDLNHHLLIRTVATCGLLLWTICKFVSLFKKKSVTVLVILILVSTLIKDYYPHRSVIGGDMVIGTVRASVSPDFVRAVSLKL